MGRFYSVQTNAVSVSVAQDVIELLAATGKALIIHEVIIGQYSDMGDAQAEALSVLFKRASGSYTSGSGGTTPTPAPHCKADTAAGVTAEMNNTTQASAGSGALTTIRADVWNVQLPYQYLPPPEQRISIAPAEALVVSITVPADAITANVTVVFEELG